MKIKKLSLIMICFLLFFSVSCNKDSNSSASFSSSSVSSGSSDNSLEEQANYNVVAYVTVPASENWRWIGQDENGQVVSEVDTRYVTHINFAFGMLEAYQFENQQTKEPLKEGEIVAKDAYKDPADNQYHYRITLQGWIEEMKKTVDGRVYLESLGKLREEKPDLKILLSLGGWDSDGFCYMAREKEGRAEFIESCAAIIREYDLDGIDLDWEYPTNGGWNAIASCEHCVDDANALLMEMRASFDESYSDDHKLLTIASGASQPWVTSETFKALDYMNVMCYDYDPGSGGSQADLNQGAHFMKLHADMVGNTAENRKKINLGIPFYNEGGPYLEPYYKGWTGHIDASEELCRKKMQWVKQNGYGGAFYWNYSMDVFEQDRENPNDPEIKILQRTVYEELNG